MEPLETTVVIHPGQVKGFNVDELEMEAARIVERTRVVLEQKFGMLLSESGVPLHNPRWRIYRPECHEWISAGTVEVDGVGALDHSPTHDKKDPLSGRPHLEYSDKRLAAANERLTDMLGRLADLEEPDSVEVVEGQKKLGDYVR